MPVSFSIRKPGLDRHKNFTPGKPFFCSHVGLYCTLLLLFIALGLAPRSHPFSRGIAGAMGKGALIGPFVLIATAGVFWPQIQYGWEEIRLGGAERHIKPNGPDKKTADFIESMGSRVLPRRDRIAVSCKPYLDGRNPNKACAALQIFTTLRASSAGPSATFPLQKDSERFVAELDQMVSDNFSHWTLFRNSDGYRDISLYLSLLPSPEGTRLFKEVASSTAQNGHALICIAWRRDPADMDFLFPFMIGESMEAGETPKSQLARRQCARTCPA